MSVRPGEWLALVEMVEKYGDTFVIGLVQEAADYLLSQGNGFIVSR